jgi:hypothetical protein
VVLLKLLYKAIPSTKNVSDFNPTMWKNSILHYENENLIKADWLTMWILKMFPHNISLAESDPDKVWETIFNFGCLVCYLFSVCCLSPSVFLCVFYKLDESAPVLLVSAFRFKCSNSKPF